jgi:hypothetical protein
MIGRQRGILMELKGASYLYTLATLMITFAGFAALLLIIRQGAGAQLSALDRFITRTVVGHLFILTAGALSPVLLSFYEIPEALIWKSSALTFGTPMLAILLTYPSRRKAVYAKQAPLSVLATLVGLGSVSFAVMIAYVFGGFEYPSAAYMTALTINFLTTAFGFWVGLDFVVTKQTNITQ